MPNHKMHICASELEVVTHEPEAAMQHLLSLMTRLTVIEGPQLSNRGDKRLTES